MQVGVAMGSDSLDLICSAVMSLVCLQAPIGDTRVVFSNFGLGSSAVVEGQGWTATLGLMNDSRQTAPQLANACDGALCVDYRVDCEPGASACVYKVRGGPSGLTTINIRAEDEAGLTAARTSLAIVVDRQKVSGLRLDMMPTLDETMKRAR